MTIPRHPLWSLISAFGATGTLLALSLLLGVWLALRLGARALWRWVACLAIVGVLTALSKIALQTCTPSWPDLHSPSGHVSFAVAFYGAAARLLVGERRDAAALALGAGTLAWVLVIALSRVGLGAHTPSEVLAGLLIGLTGLCWFARDRRLFAAPPSPRTVLIGTGVLLALGLSLPAQALVFEPWLLAAAQALRPHADGLCVGRWRAG